MEWRLDNQSPVSDESIYKQMEQGSCVPWPKAEEERRGEERRGEDETKRVPDWSHNNNLRLTTTQNKNDFIDIT